jgi:hypothetical protein
MEGFAMSRMTGWRCAHRAAALLWVCAIGAPATAQTAVDLQLALMVDASGSVNQTRFELQKRGYVAALRNPRVLQAILGGRTQSIAVTMVQWTGPFLQRQVLPWTLFKDEASIKSGAAIIEQTPRQLFGGGTSISGAVDHAMSLFPQSPFKGERRVIDVSGDGANNAGELIVPVRDSVLAQGVTINGLPIMLKRPNPSTLDIENLDVYYEDCVIGGPGAFVVPIHNTAQFIDATRTKLILEVAGRQPESRVVPASADKPRISCTIGERLWRDRWGGRGYDFQ